MIKRVCHKSMAITAHWIGFLHGCHCRIGIDQNSSSGCRPGKEVNMKRLKESEDEWDIDTLRLILEFDRWNNFRILGLQRPTAACSPKKTGNDQMF